jgi:hypothetical protein
LNFSRCEIVFQGGCGDLYSYQHLTKLSLLTSSRTLGFVQVSQFAAGQQSLISYKEAELVEF